MRRWGPLLAVLLLIPGIGGAAGGGPVYISIIIDDLGDRPSAGRRVTALPGPVACAILPGSPYADPLARAAHASGKEVLAHLPMQSVSDREASPGTLTEAMDRETFQRSLERSLTALPHLAGVNNHRGSHLTSQGEPMRWLMEALRAHGGLYFVDSRTTHATLAEATAKEFGVPTLRRHVFLDVNPDPVAV